MHNLASSAWKEEDKENAISFVIKVEKIPLRISNVLPAVFFADFIPPAQVMNLPSSASLWWSSTFIES